MKDWQVRINETIEFIRTADVLTNANKRGAVAQALQFMNDSGDISEALSRSMSQGTLWKVIGRGQEQENRH